MPTDAKKSKQDPEASDEESSGTLKELAEAEIKLSTLLLDFSTYKRQFSSILKSPLPFFGRFGRADAGQLKPSVSFMLQGITLAFVIFTAGWSLPRSLAGYVATNVPLIGGSRSELDAYRGRLQAINRTLPADLTKTWREQEELMLAIRVLPADRFQRLLDRLEILKQSNPDLLALAIDGSLARGERFGGRGYILAFFHALDPEHGHFLYDTYQLTSIGPQHKLPPHVDFLLWNVVLWYLTSFTVSRLVSKDDKTPFVLGAYLVGFLSPLFQAYTAAVHLYLAAVLPAYIRQAGDILMGGARTLGLPLGGVFPFENLLVTVFRTVGPLVVVGFAVAALAAGLREAYSISKNRAWMAAAVGVGLGLGCTEAVAFVLRLVLAPTGLLS